VQIREHRVSLRRGQHAASEVGRYLARLRALGDHDIDRVAVEEPGASRSPRAHNDSGSDSFAVALGELSHEVCAPDR